MSIPREAIDADADKVVRRLKRHGHTAYLVGGCVRDLLLGRRPKDFDVATSATPPETKELFRNCRIIGRRFRLAHIFFGSKIIETSTFRTNPREGVPLDQVEELLIRRDNVFGTAEDDAKRRDFTINGLFYDVEAGEVIDYVGGLSDLEAKLVRTIGDPDIRFREDPIRILRAIKFAARLDFQIEPATYQAMLAHRGEIPKSATPRVLEEVYRLLRGGAARRSMELLLETGVAATLAPELAWMFAGDAAVPEGMQASLLPAWLFEDAAATQRMRERAWRVLGQLDALVASDGKDAIVPPVPTNALVPLMLTAPFLPEVKPGERDVPSDLTLRIEQLLHPLVQRLRVSRRDAERARQALLAQRRLLPGRRRRSRPMALVKRDYFAEALTIYELLALADGESRDEIARWKSMWRSAQRPHAGERRREERPREVVGDQTGPIDLERSVEAEAPPGEGEGEGEGDAPRPIWSEDGAPAAAAEGRAAAGAAGEQAQGEPGRKRRRRRRGGRRRRRPTDVSAAMGGTPLVAAPDFAGNDPDGGSSPRE